MINIKKAKDYVPRALIPLTLDFHLRSQNCQEGTKACIYIEVAFQNKH